MYAAVLVLPAVVREGFVGLRHPMRVLLLLDRATAAVGAVQDLAGHPLDHGLLRTSSRVLHDPAHREGDAAWWTDLDRHLIGGTPDAPRAHLDERLHPVERTLEDGELVFLRALPDESKSIVEDVLGEALLSVVHHRVDELGHRPIVVLGIGQNLSTFDFTLAWHGAWSAWPSPACPSEGDDNSAASPHGPRHFGFLAPYFERPWRRSC